MEKKFSIIVPVFNAEAFLKRCLDSLVHQDMIPDEYEIIVIDDGSQDGTEAVLDEYVRKYTHVRVFSQANQGVSAARNYGCRVAEGKYWLFVDSDDWIQADTLSTLYAKMEEDALDMLVMDYRYWGDRGVLPKPFSYAPGQPVGVLPGKEFMKHCFPYVVWSIVYRASYWQKYAFSFLPIRHEDTELMPRLLYYAQRVDFLPLDFYHYYENPRSFMMNYATGACLYMVRAMEHVNRFRLEEVKEPAVSRLLYDFMATQLLVAFKRGIRWDAPRFIQRNMIAEMKALGLSPISTRKGCLYAWMYRYVPELFISFYRWKLRGKRK